jgi:hypothetical protein
LRESSTPEDGNTLRGRQRIDEKFQPLPPEIRFSIRRPGEVAGGVCEALNETQADRVRHEGEHDLGRESGLLKRSDRRRRNCDDDLRPLRREVSDEGVQAIDIPFSAKYLDMRGAAVLVAKCGKRLEQQMDRGAMGEPAVQNTDMRTSLRASGRCDRAA